MVVRSVHYLVLTIARSAICLSALHAPSPPEPAKLGEEPVTDEAAKPPSLKDLATPEPESILKLHVCGHEFHAECLVSWFVLRKTSCPICRAVYYSKEAMQSQDDEAQLRAPQLVHETAVAPVVSHGRSFVHGNSVFGDQSATESQPTTQPSPPRYPHI